MIDRDYIRTGLRSQERATLELGPRSARKIAQTFTRETRPGVGRASLTRLAHDHDGLVDLRPGATKG